MPKAIKYYSDEELEQKLKELENLKAQREKEKKELLDRAKIAYMDKLIADGTLPALAEKYGLALAG